MSLFPCTGNSSDHCCYIAGEVCPYLEENTIPGRRWACGLLVKYGSWAAMNESPEYHVIGQHWKSMGEAFNLCELHNPVFCCRPEWRMGRANPRSEPRLDLIGVIDGDVG